jgi:hypothetical protein
MGGTASNRWMMGAAGYQWMFGGGHSPAWMRGTPLPIAMAGTSIDMGKVMGRLWAAAPGTRSPGQAARLGSQIPAGAVVSKVANTVTFSSRGVSLIAVASAPGGPDERFRIAGLTDPTITVAAGARVSIEVVNADPDTAHGLVITASHNVSAPMPMMTDRPAFPGRRFGFLVTPPAPGCTRARSPSKPQLQGGYRYLCPIPGHARDGMTGTLTVVADYRWRPAPRAAGSPALPAALSAARTAPRRLPYSTRGSLAVVEHWLAAVSRGDYERAVELTSEAVEFAGPCGATHGRRLLRPSPVPEARREAHPPRSTKHPLVDEGHLEQLPELFQMAID